MVHGAHIVSGKNDLSPSDDLFHTAPGFDNIRKPSHNGERLVFIGRHQIDIGKNRIPGDAMDTAVSGHGHRLVPRGMARGGENSDSRKTSTSPDRVSKEISEKEVFRPAGDAHRIYNKAGWGPGAKSSSREWTRKRALGNWSRL